MPKKPPTLSLVVPAYQEAHRIEACAEGIRRAIVAADMETEVILVDNGSTDGTSEKAQEFLGRLPNFQLLQQDQKGKGAALKRGVAASSGDFVFLACDVTSEQTKEFNIDRRSRMIVKVAKFLNEQ